MRESFRIDFDRPDRTYRVGETVRGRVVMETARGDRCEAIRLRRFWRTHGKGNVDKGEPMGALLHSGPLHGPGPFEFDFEFPAPPGPFSYHGRYLNVDQFVEVRVDLPWALDPKLREDYLLLPGTPVSPPPHFLEKPDESARSALLGCSAFAGISISLFGLFAFLFLNPMGLIFLLAGIGVMTPFLRAKAAQRLGNATAFLTSVVVEPGREVEVEVKVSPRKEVRLNGISLVVTAWEVCVSGSGSSRKTHRHELFSGRSTLSGPMVLEGGKVGLFRGSVRIPEDAPPSFKAGDNRLTWEAKVRVDIPAWPDWLKRIPFVVWPAASSVAAPPREAVLAEAADMRFSGETIPDHPSQDEALLLQEPSGVPLMASDDDGTDPSSDQDLQEAMRRIREGELFGGERDRLIHALVGQEYGIVLEVKRVERSFGLYSDAAYRNGRTVTGTLPGSRDEVVVYFPEDRNEEVEAWEAGSVQDVRGRVRKWDPLRKRLELLAQV